MIDVDGQPGIFPVGFTDCSRCHRLIKTEHADVDGMCGGCAEEAKQETEQLIRDTYPAVAGKSDSVGKK